MSSSSRDTSMSEPGQSCPVSGPAPMNENLSPDRSSGA